LALYSIFPEGTPLALYSEFCILNSVFSPFYLFAKIIDLQTFAKKKLFEIGKIPYIFASPNPTIQ